MKRYQITLAVLLATVVNVNAVAESGKCQCGDSRPRLSNKRSARGLRRKLISPTPRRHRTAEFAESLSAYAPAASPLEELLSPSLRRRTRNPQPNPAQKAREPRIPPQRIRQRFAVQINQIFATLVISFAEPPKRIILPVKADIHQREVNRGHVFLA